MSADAASAIERQFCFGALSMAVDRWERATAMAVQLPASEEAVRFSAIGETLFWASCLDEAADRARDGLTETVAQLLNGLHYARNRATHDLVQVTAAHNGLIFPIRFPARFTHYRWKESDKIPPPMRGPGSGDARAPRDGYIATWQGQHVDPILRGLIEHFNENHWPTFTM